MAIAKVAFGEGVLPEGSSSGSNAEKETAKRLRERCTAMLQIHKQHSSPRQIAIGDAGVTHQWAMQCSRKAELHGVVSELLGALKAHAMKVIVLKNCACDSALWHPRVCLFREPHATSCH